MKEIQATEVVAFVVLALSITIKEAMAPLAITDRCSDVTNGPATMQQCAGSFRNVYAKTTLNLRQPGHFQ